MKKSSSLIVLAIAMFSTLGMAYAQSPFGGGGGFGGPVYEPGAFRAFSGQIGQSLASPSRVWVSGNYADRGLGYQGSYATLGVKTRLFEDALDGRWLFEGRGHISEEGGFFVNLGIERMFSIESAGADVGLGFWFDYDDDTGAFTFSDAYESVGVTGKIKTRYWDLVANGYFAIGTSDTTIGDPTGSTPFFGNSLALVTGIDSALSGFDVTVRTRPEQLAFINGTFDFGGYGYESELVEFFGGGRIRMTAQLLQGVILSGELNYDDRFDATGVVGLTLLYGANGRNHEYSGIGKDLDQTLRNDHIVRYHRDVILAIDPDTGAAYDVIHVDNSADAGTADGTFENPFTNLADAEMSSGEDDIIFVREGDGTVTGYDEGIVLKNGQLFLADGINHLVPIANGGVFGSFLNLFGDLDGVRPTITANNFGNAVTLASRNTVRGFRIDGSQAQVGMSTGIFGSAATLNDGGLIENNFITDAVLDGVGINNLAGDWRFADNDIQRNGFSGISLINACDPTSVFTFENNVVNNNNLDGIQMINYDAAAINFIGNTTNNNGRDGIRLETFKGDPLVGIDIIIDDHIARFNNGDGINIIGGTGSLRIQNSIIGTEFNLDTGTILAGGNVGNGISITDFTTPDASDIVLIENNNISSNGVGGDAGVNFQLNEGFARVLITENVIDANGIGVRTRTDDIDPINGIPTILDIQVINNDSIGSNVGGNLADGLRFIGVGGSSQNILVENPDSVLGLLPIVGSGNNGISFIVGDENGGVLSNMIAVVRNTAIIGSGQDGIFTSVTDDAQISLLVENSLVNLNGTGLNFSLDTAETLAVNTIIVQNNTLDNNAGSGIIMDTFDGTFTDFAVINNGITNTNRVGRPDGVTPPGLGDGIRVTAMGDADILNPQIDNRTRLFITGNTIDLFHLDGIDVFSSGDASVVATIESNISTSNGDGFLTPGNTQPDLPFSDGIALTATGSSAINARVANNFVTLNAEFGAHMVTVGDGTINALFESNNLNGNDISEDPNNDPVFDANGIDLVAVNSGTGQMALSFTNNFLLGDVFVNNAAPGDFLIELDGLSNGPLFGMGLVNITQVGFGSTVDGLITAEEGAFTAAGFPANPPPILFP
jgi:hypothetical protein